MHLSDLLVCVLFTTGFFLTPAAEKTKTQEKNSRKKLNLWEDFPSNLENSRKKT